MFLDPLVAQFFRALSRGRPTRSLSSPPWDLQVVLDELTVAPFKPIRVIHIHLLTFKLALLVAITLAGWVNELQALSIKEPFLRILPERVILKTDPGFLPKVVSGFHREQDIVLQLLSQTIMAAGEKFAVLDDRSYLL